PPSTPSEMPSHEYEPSSVPVQNSVGNMNYFHIPWPTDNFQGDKLFPNVDNECGEGTCLLQDDDTCITIHASSGGWDRNIYPKHNSMVTEVGQDICECLFEAGVNHQPTDESFRNLLCEIESTSHTFDELNQMGAGAILQGNFDEGQVCVPHLTTKQDGVASGVKTLAPSSTAPATDESTSVTLRLFGGSMKEAGLHTASSVGVSNIKALVLDGKKGEEEKDGPEAAVPKEDVELDRE
ncbi:hypothetical protein THAOC_04780, partial [Thalassiosira oceanica]